MANYAILCHCDGANASTTYTNAGTGGTLARTGSAALTTANKKFGTAGSDHTVNGSVLSASSVSLGTGDFTISFQMIRVSGFGGKPFCIGSEGTVGGLILEFFVNQVNLQVTTTGSNTNIIALTGTNLGDNGTGWHHVVIERKSGTIYLAVDGVNQGSVANTSSFSGRVMFGDKAVSPGTPEGGNLGGYLDEFLVINDTALYTSLPTSFTAPTAEYTIPTTGIDGGSISSGEAIGAPTIGAGVSAAGIATAQALGAPVVGGQVSTAGGIASAQAVGTPTLGAGITGGSVASAQAIGAPIIGAGIGTAGGIASTEAVGSPAVGGGIAPAGIGSGEALGAPALAAVIGGAGGIASGEAVGTPGVSASGIYAAGIPTAEALGQPAVGAGVAAAGVGTAEAIGAPLIGSGIAVGSIGTGEAEGQPGIGAAITGAGGIASAEAFGAPLVAPPGIFAAGIPSGEAFGQPAIAAGIGAVGIGSGEGVGSPLVGEAPPQLGGLKGGFDVEVGPARRRAQMVYRKPILQRVLEERHANVKPRKERAAKRAKTIELQAAALVLEKPITGESRFKELARQWMRQRPFVPEAMAGISPFDLFASQVAFRIRQQQLEDQALRMLAAKRAQDDEDALIALLLA